MSACPTKVGFVYLVGAGPGDPQLLTCRALELLRSADVVAHDSLIPQVILDLVGIDTDLVSVGRRAGDGTVIDRIHPAVLELARAGRHVVRLKAGDPFVFGRGGEEAQALAEAKIPFQIVPGISSALGAAAYAGIPLTHRDHASAVTFATGHDAPSVSPIVWESAEKTVARDTVVLFMAARSIRENIAKLLATGRSLKTPAACISCATRPNQKIVRGTLEDITDEMEQAKLQLPALVFVGDVVSLSEEISWIGKCPLWGRRILVGRSRPGRSKISSDLRALGAQVHEVPYIEIDRTPVSKLVADRLKGLDRFDGIVFACVSGVDAVVAHVREVRSLTAGMQHVVAIGRSVTDTLLREGVTPSRSYEGSCVAELSRKEDWHGLSLALFTSQEGRPRLASDLRELGATIEELVVYRVRRMMSEPPPGSIDLLVLPSSSSARAVLDHCNVSDLKDTPTITIGVHTESEARAGGLTQVFRTDEDTPECMVKWVENVWGGAGGGRFV